ncbi:MAG: helix-turn-helix domain-containing protein [Lachnospiraceae bacterium]|nr:helix-turn-helix domain-containing protein [Lachnospiraceae bacterium]
MEFTNLLESYNDVLVPEDIQEILHTGRNTVYNYLANGIIKSIKVGGKYRIPKLYLLEYMYPEIDFCQGGDSYSKT